MAPDGLTASLTSAVPGTYTVVATSDDDESVSGSIDVTVAAEGCAPASGAVVTHSADVVADETWEGGAVHSVPGSIQIRQGRSPSRRAPS